MAALIDLARAIEARDPYSSGHAVRVTALAEVIGARLGWDDEQIEVLRIGAALHDIGKLAVSDAVLRKPGPLSDGELDEVRSHPEEGARMLGLIGTLRVAVPCCAPPSRTMGRARLSDRRRAARPSLPRPACSPSPTRTTR